ncbi:IS66 family insertion sequence element accessory protein TnpB [Pseudomonas sp. NR3]|uniref:IS66 family insertion sequence element accessory protein TnpB n=1 Tax=Pseudomonas sp. NR3 TaxID=3155978 RepID=UPI003B68222C
MTIWLATEPMDMRAGTNTALARVIAVFGAAKPHCAYLFANRRATRTKVLVHDGFGIGLAARRLNQGKSIGQAFTKARKWSWIPNTPEHLRALANGYREAHTRDRTTQAFEVCQAQRADES